MANIFDLADTWNNAGTTFTAIKMNVTNTASGAASLLLDLEVGGSSLFTVSKSGAVFSGDNGTVSAPSFSVNGRGGIYSAGIGQITLLAGTTPFVQIDGGRVRIPSDASYDWGTVHGTSTLSLIPDASDILAQRRTTNAQTWRLYGTFTDASNYRRVQLAMTTAGVATLKPEGAGTGASGNVLHISGLPTSNPGAGILWNNSGTPAIGT